MLAESVGAQYVRPLRQLALVLAGLVALGVIACSPGDGESDGLTQTPAGAGTAVVTAPPSTIPGYQAGEAAAVGALELTLEAVEFIEEDLLPTDSGNHYLFAQFRVRNSSSEPYVFAAATSVLVVAETDVQHSWTFTAGGHLLELTIPAGGEVRGDVAFEVPRDVSNFDIVYVDPGGGARAFWPIDSQSPPAQVAATPVEMGQPLLPGESGEVGPLRVTVERVERSEGDIHQPETGNEFMLISLRIENTGDQVELVVPDVQGFLLDEYGFNQENAFWILPDDDPLLGELGPREEVRGHIAFEVERGASPLYLLYAEIFGSDVQVWEIQ